MRVLRLLRTKGHTPAVEAAVVALARPEENGILWHGLAASGAVLHPARRPVHLRAIAAVLSTLVVSTAVKAMVRRAA